MNRQKKTIWIRSIGHRADRLMYRAARFLNRRTASVKPRTWRIIMLVFVVTGCGLYGLIITDTFLHPQLPATGKLKQPVLRRPVTEHRIQLPASVIRFDRYMDSLPNTAAGKLAYDSILHQRPGLLDSLDQVKRLYAH